MSAPSNSEAAGRWENRRPSLSGRGCLFILALKGLASPATSRAGNRNGMIGMVIAVVTTLWVAGVTDP